MSITTRNKTSSIIAADSNVESIEDKMKRLEAESKATNDKLDQIMGILAKLTTSAQPKDDENKNANKQTSYVPFGMPTGTNELQSELNSIQDITIPAESPVKVNSSNNNNNNNNGTTTSRPKAPIDETQNLPEANARYSLNGDSITPSQFKIWKTMIIMQCKSIPKYQNLIDVSPEQSWALFKKANNKYSVNELEVPF